MTPCIICGQEEPDISRALAEMKADLDRAVDACRVALSALETSHHDMANGPRIIEAMVFDCLKAAIRGAPDNRVVYIPPTARKKRRTY